MRPVTKCLSVALLVAGVACFQAAEYYKAKIAASERVGDELEAKIAAQREYNAQNAHRIETRARISTILARFSGSLRHNPSLLAELIMVKSGQYGIDPYLILGVIQAESSFNSRAVSPKGALGLMQLRPHTADFIAPGMELAVENADALMDDNELNISLGTKYLAKLIRRFGSLDLALEAYNRGPSQLHQQLEDGDEVGTGYAGKVYSHYHRFKASGQRL
ncbi:MAG: lytic transglycosylase domain-containing protein [Nitrospinae bacterium]|nr:lytic transglycosylase domain-containing protein [Nitrospinota bacterium]